SGPIKDFLAEVSKLKQDRTVGSLFLAQPAVSAFVTPVPAPAPQPQVAFTVQVEGLDSNPGEVGHLASDLQPLLSSDPPPNAPQGDLFGTPTPPLIKRVPLPLPPT